MFLFSLAPHHPTNTLYSFIIDLEVCVRSYTSLNIWTSGKSPNRNQRSTKEETIIFLQDKWSFEKGVRIFERFFDGIFWKEHSVVNSYFFFTLHCNIYVTTGLGLLPFWRMVLPHLNKRLRLYETETLHINTKRVKCNMSCNSVHAYYEYEARLVSSPHDLKSVLNFKFRNSKLLPFMTRTLRCLEASRPDYSIKQRHKPEERILSYTSAKNSNHASFSLSRDYFQSQFFVIYNITVM